MKTVMDPQEVVAFVRSVSDETERLRNANRNIAIEQIELINVWDDDKGLNFSRLFENANESVARMTERIEQFCELLNQKAQHVQNYLDE